VSVSVVVMLINCCVDSNTEVEDEYKKKYETWAEQERCGFCRFLLLAS